MTHMALLATQQEESAFEAAQSRSPVIYTCALDSANGDESSIIVKESRNLLSAGGTTGMRTWDAALHLGMYLLSQDINIIKNKQVLELGAGTGFLSLLCASFLGASKVVSSDGSPDVVRLIETNIEMNRHCLSSENTVYAELLEWGKEATLKFHDRYFTPSRPCDLVIATDVVILTRHHTERDLEVD